jgi:4'-phosphopantetheinyl transferase
VSDAALQVGFAVWPHARLAALVARNEVLVCSASLAAAGDALAQAIAVLDPAERERFERYENSAVARRFAVGRLRLREMLGALLAIPPRAVPIQIGVHGKPALSRGLQRSGVRFSVAHYDELMLVALTRAGDVGIDVECVRPIERWARVADRVFNPAERAEIGREIARGDEPSAVLLRFWCRGEAELKAIGSGISGLGAHREGWHPSGMRVAELSDVPLPTALESEPVRYQAAVALWTARDASGSRAPSDTSQATPPRITPASASTA